MARTIITKITDDLDGSEDQVQPLRFGFEGGDYEIDLSATNYLRLLDMMEPYIERARKVGGRRMTRLPRPTPATTATLNDTDDEQRHEPPATNGHKVADLPARVVTELPPAGQTEYQLIRSWYAGQPTEFKTEHPISPRGRIAKPIVEAYREAVGQ